MQVVSTILVALLLLTIIGIPYGIKKYVDWQLAQQEILFEDRSIRDALRGSTHTVRRHWWHTGAVAGTFWLLSQIPGPALGFALLFTTIPITTVNLIGSVVFALTIPYVGIGRTLLYLDLGARKETQRSVAPRCLESRPPPEPGPRQPSSFGDLPENGRSRTRTWDLFLIREAL